MTEITVVEELPGLPLVALIGEMTATVVVSGHSLDRKASMMRTYVFGVHQGEFPLALVSGDDSSKIWAAAPLEGPTHNAFFAVEAPTQQALADKVATITGAGVHVADDPAPVCVTPDCLGLLGPGKLLPCDLVEHFLEFLFCILEGNEPITKLVTELHAEVGEKAVGAAYNGKGQFVVEVGVQTADQAEKVRKMIEANTSATVSSIHVAKTIHRLV